MTNSFLKSLAILIVLAPTFATPAALARTVYPAQGGRGDAQAEDNCPKGQYLVGFKGRVGAWADHVQIICGKMLANGSYGPPEYYGPVRGGNSGTPAETSCLEGSAIAGVLVNYTPDNRQTGNIMFDCRGPGIAESRNWGSPQATHIDDRQRFDCPAREMATGVVVNYGRHVNALGLICDRVAIPTASAPPATSYSPAAPKPIRPTGRPKVAPVPTAMITAFGGAWKTANSAHGNFEITLQLLTPYNPSLPAPIPVYGTFVSTDGATQYDGVIQGRIEPGTRTLMYNYTQRGTGNTGGGQFTLSTDGNAITGNGNDTKSGGYTWTGTRK